MVGQPLTSTLGVMNLFLQSFARHTCPTCGGKVHRVPFSFGDSFIHELVFFALYVIAFMLVGFFVQGLGGSSFLASLLAMGVVTLIAYPIQFRSSSYRCKPCSKVYGSTELKSRGWFSA